MKQLIFYTLILFTFSCNQQSYEDKVMDWAFYTNKTMVSKFDAIDEKYKNTTDIDNKLNDLVDTGCECLSYFDLSSLDNEEEVIKEGHKLMLTLLKDMSKTISKNEPPKMMTDERFEVFVLVGQARECFYEAGRRAAKRLNGVEVSSKKRSIRTVMEETCPEGTKIHDKLERLHKALN